MGSEQRAQETKDDSSQAMQSACAVQSGDGSEYQSAVTGVTEDVSPERTSLTGDARPVWLVPQGTAATARPPGPHQPLSQNNNVEAGPSSFQGDPVVAPPRKAGPHTASPCRADTSFPSPPGQRFPRVGVPPHSPYSGAVNSDPGGGKPQDVLYPPIQYSGGPANAGPLGSPPASPPPRESVGPSARPPAGSPLRRPDLTHDTSDVPMAGHSNCATASPSTAPKGSQIEASTPPNSRARRSNSSRESPAQPAAAATISPTAGHDVRQQSRSPAPPVERHEESSSHAAAKTDGGTSGDRGSEGTGAGASGPKDDGILVPPPRSHYHAAARRRRSSTGGSVERGDRRRSKEPSRPRTPPPLSADLIPAVPASPSGAYPPSNPPPLTPLFASSSSPLFSSSSCIIKAQSWYPISFCVPGLRTLELFPVRLSCRAHWCLSLPPPVPLYPTMLLMGYSDYCNAIAPFSGTSKSSPCVSRLARCIPPF